MSPNTRIQLHIPVLAALATLLLLAVCVFPVCAASGAVQLQGSPLPLDRERYRITLKQSGLYRITYQDLAGAGFPLATADPRLFSLYRGADEVAIDVAGEEDGRFDPGDVLRFYAPPASSLLTDLSTFWLAVGETSGRRMEARSVAPQGMTPQTSFAETVRFEQDKVYRSNMPMLSDVDHWYWAQTSVIGFNASLTLTVPFEIEQPLALGAARFSAELWGASSDSRVNPDHHVRFAINDVPVGSVEWDGAVATVGTAVFTQALLRPGQNRLTLYMPAGTGAVDPQGRPWEVSWLNWFDITYERAMAPAGKRLLITPVAGRGEFQSDGWASPDLFLYDIADPLTPVRLTDFSAGSGGPLYSLRFADDVPGPGRYMAATGAGLLTPLGISGDPPSGLRNAPEGVDYLIITHAAFLDAVQPLADFRRTQGYAVRVVDVQDVYDEFSGGVLSYHAIRDFIGHAFHRWPQPGLRFVLLAGDGTYDFMNREGYGAGTFIPPFLAAVDPLLGETAADNRFAAVEGEDVLADVYLGRLPANSVAEMEAMIGKIIAYERTPLPGEWRTHSVFVADNPDAAGNFHALSDAAGQHMPPGWQSTRIYLGTGEFPVSQTADAQQAVREAFDAGALLVNYTGHASITSWAAELLLTTTTAGQLKNGAMTPVVLPMTCLEGAYHNPRFPGLSETLLRVPAGGAVASWGPTGKGVATGHDFLHQGFLDALFGRDLYILGEATEAGKRNLYENARSADGSPRFRDLIDTYVLLGDPATQVGVPRDVDLEITASVTAGPHDPGAAVAYTLDYRNAGQGRAQDVRIEAMLPEWLVGLTWSATGPGLAQVEDSKVVWTLSQLGRGEGGVITINGRVDPATPLTAYPLAARFNMASAGIEADPPDNVTGPVYLNLGQADVALAQALLPPTPVKPGQLITVSLAYTNYGPAVATGLRIDLPLSFPLEQLTLEQAGPDVTPVAGSQYAFSVDALARGSSGSMIVSGRIPFGIIAQQMRVKVAAKARLALPDPDTSNNAGGPDTLVIHGADEYEPDDAAFQARFVSLPLHHQTHLYEPAGDEDWVAFRAERGATYRIRTEADGAQQGMLLYLRDAAGVFLDSSDGSGGDGVSEVRWTAPADAHYYLAIAGGVATPGQEYQLSIAVEPYRGHLPWIQP